MSSAHLLRIGTGKLLINLLYRYAFLNSWIRSLGIVRKGLLREKKQKHNISLETRRGA